MSTSSVLEFRRIANQRHERMLQSAKNAKEKTQKMIQTLHNLRLVTSKRSKYFADPTEIKEIEPEVRDLENSIFKRAIPSLSALQTSNTAIKRVHNEALVTERLALREHGVSEIKNFHGRVDCITKEYIIEVKNSIKSYKHALGQILAYKEEFPGLKMRVHFANHYCYRAEKKQKILQLFKKYDITVTFGHV